MSLGSIVVRLSMNTAGFDTDTKRAASIAKKRADDIDKAFTRAGKAIGLALGTAFVAAGAAATVALKNAVASADELSKSAQKIGITTEALSTLSYAARLADVDLGQLQAGLGRLTRFQDEAAQGTERNVEVFKSLGIEFQNLDGTLRDAGAVFKDFARATEDMTGPDKAALALEVFGRAGADLIPLLNTGAEGIEKLEERARRLGLELSTGAGKDAEELNDRMSDLWSVFEGLALTVATDLLPDIIELTDALADTIREGGGMVEVGRDIADIFRGLAKIFKAADLAIDGMGERLNIAGQYKNIFLDPRGWETYLANIAKSEQRLEGLAEQSKQLALAARQDFGIDPKVIWIDPPPPPASGGRRRGTPMLDGETVVIRPPEGEVFGSSRGSLTSRAEAAAARESEAAARALAASIRDAERAQADFLRTTEDLRAEIGGPLAQVTLDYVRREDELIELAKLAGLTNEELARSLAILESARLRDVDAIKAQAEAEAQRARELAAQPLIDQMDDLRDATAGFFVDFVKNGEDAVDRLADYIFTSALQGIGKMLAEQMWGAVGTTGGGMFGSGAAGGGWASFLGSLFQKRATGGPVYPGQAYLVGEEGPELVMPKAAGVVLPAQQTAKVMGGGRGQTNNITFVLPGRNDMRTEAQRQADLGRATQRQLSRSTA